MNFSITIDGRSFPLRLERSGDGWLANGRAVSALEVEPGIYSVLLGSRSLEARVEFHANDGMVVHVAGRRLVLEVSDPRQLSRKHAGVHREGRDRIAAPMPGKIVRVLVGHGDTVEAGQSIVVVEAMKMQNELKTARAGRVVTLAAREGATVAAGEVLAVIE